MRRVETQSPAPRRPGRVPPFGREWDTGRVSRSPSPPDPIPGVEIRQRKRRDGTTYFVYRVRWKDPATGKRLVETLSTPQDALDFHAHLRLARRRGVLGELDQGRELLTDFAADWWERYAKHNLDQTTRKTYASIWNRHLLPRVGHLQLRQITPAVVDRLKSDLQDDGVGAPTIRKAMSLLQAILREAVAWDRLRLNPVKQIRKPRAPRKRAVIAVSPEQVEALRDALPTLPGPGARQRAGLRRHAPGGRSRTRGATPRARDAARRAEERRRIHRHGPEGRPTATHDRSARTATTGSHRVHACNAAGERRKRCCSLARTASHGAKPTIATGAAECSIPPRPPWDSRPSSRTFHTSRSTESAADARRPPTTGCTPYDLRHSFASLLLRDGRLSLAEIAEQLGNSVATLSDVYAHVIADMKGQPRTSADDAIMQARMKRAKQAQ